MNNKRNFKYIYEYHDPIFKIFYFILTNNISSQCTIDDNNGKAWCAHKVDSRDKGIKTCPK